MDHSAVAKELSARDPQGRWLKGHHSVGGPGRLPRSVDQQYLDVMLGECNLVEWKAICRMAVEDAKGPNLMGRRYGREWLARIIMPAIERIMVAAINVNVDASDSQAMMRRLVSMLSLDNDAPIDADVVDITNVNDEGDSE